MSQDSANETPDYSLQLAHIEQSMQGLTDTAEAVQEIGLALEGLYEGGADEDKLLVINDKALVVAETVQHLDQALKTSLNLARNIQEQRNTALRNLSGLKEAIADIDMTVPEISDLVEIVEEGAIEEAEYQISEMVAESITDDIGWNVSLSWDKTHRFFDILRAGVLKRDHPLFEELRDWVDRAIEAVDEAHRAEIDARRKALSEFGLEDNPL